LIAAERITFPHHLETAMSFRHTPRQPDTIWILTADRAHARIFRSSPHSPELDEVHSLIHEESECHAHEVQSDRLGRFSSRSGESVSGDPETDFRHKTAQEFACQIADVLEQGRVHGDYGRLLIFDPPLLLGILRKHLSDQVNRLIAVEEDQDLMQLAPAAVAERAQRALSCVAALRPTPANG